MLLVTATMERYPDIGLDSYDRFFPSQDTMPAGGFGNLIALPLQNRPREKDNSAFLNDDLYPYDDQWAYLSTIGRMSPQALVSIVPEAAATGQIIGVRLPATEEDDEPWAALPSRRNKEIAIEGILPQAVEIILGNQIFIDRSNLPTALVNRIARLAEFQNPDFYSAQAMRLPIFGKPRIISCAELFSKYVAFPRGCIDDLLSLFGDMEISVKLRDESNSGKPIDANFLGQLTVE